MNIFGKSIFNLCTCIIFLLCASIFNLWAKAEDIAISIHIKGVYESKMSLLALTGSGTFKPVSEVQSIKGNHTTQLSISKDYLPGEFVLRFDYKETQSSSPYPCEKHIFINDQDLELWVNPKYCNNPDSSYFQKNERENLAFAKFSEENGRQKEKLGVLQNFLMNYDGTESNFYQQGIEEYERRRQAYNQWLTTKIKEDRALFVSHLYCFQYEPEIPWKGTETDRINSLINHYFDAMDFKDPWIIKTSDLKKWMDGYVNLYGQLSTTVALRDSLFQLAGQRAIEKAKQGHPMVYGWMVDYFYHGYETNGINAGMKVLEPYLKDTNCLTSKRQEIARRLKGMETLVPGSKAPNIALTDMYGSLFKLYEFQPRVKYLLLFFWSADCSHCVEMENQLYPWQQQPEMQQKIRVVAVSLDETDTEIAAWQKKIPQMKGWKHLRAPEGVRSKVASDYYVLSTPVMILLDAKTKEIIALPNTLNELVTAIK